MFKSSVCTATKHIVGGLTKRASVVRWQAWQCDPLTNQPSTNLPSPNFPRKTKIPIACTSITQDFKFVDLYPCSTWQEYQQNSTRNFKISISHASAAHDICDVSLQRILLASWVSYLGRPASDYSTPSKPKAAIILNVGLLLSARNIWNSCRI